MDGPRPDNIVGMRIGSLHPSSRSLPSNSHTHARFVGSRTTSPIAKQRPKKEFKAVTFPVLSATHPRACMRARSFIKFSRPRCLIFLRPPEKNNDASRICLVELFGNVLVCKIGSRSKKIWQKMRDARRKYCDKNYVKIVSFYVFFCVKSCNCIIEIIM